MATQATKTQTTKTKRSAARAASMEDKMAKAVKQTAADKKAKEAAAKKAAEARKKAAAEAKAAKAKETAAKKAAAEADEKAKHTAILRELGTVAKEVNVRFQKAAQFEDKADDHRLAAALQLASVRKRCEDARINFKKWAEANITEQSYETVRKLAYVGAADDPKLALADLRGKNKEANRKARAKRAAGGASETQRIAAPKAEPAGQRAITALGSLSDDERLNLLRNQVDDLGMAVVSKTAASALKEGKDSPVDLAKSLFSKLTASEKLAFVQWAAGEIGVTVENPFEGGKGDNKYKDLSDEEALSSENGPEFLRQDKGQKKKAA